MRLRSSSRLKRVRTVALRVGVCLSLVLASGAAVVGTAQSATTTNLGTLLFTPGTGLDTSPINIHTVSVGPNTGCPTGSESVRAVVNGPGQWTNIPLIGSDSSQVSSTSEFDEPLGNSFAVIARSNSLTITAGEYVVSLICQDALGTQTFGAFTSSLFFTSPTNFQTNDPAQPVTSTATTVTASPSSPQVSGTSVSFTAAVSPSSAAGTVQFKDGSGALGSVQTLSGGHATVSTSALSTATHSISAVYTPATTAFSGSTATPITFVVSSPAAAATTTAVSANPASPSVFGAPVSFTATISPSTTGSVQFQDSGVNLSTPQAVSGGQAVLTTSALSAGSHSITAVFEPTDTTAFTGSTSPQLAFSVSPGTVQVTSTALQATPTSPSPLGSPAVFTASLMPTAAVGSVQFKDGATNLGSSQPVSAGTASITTSALTSGSHQITAVFTPTDAAAYAASTSIASTYVISGALTATVSSLSTNPASPAASGTPVTLTGSVAPAVAGTMQFKDGGSSLGAAQTLVSGSASLSTSTLSAGSHTLTAVFTPADAGTYAASTSPSITFVVSAPTGSNLGTLTFNPTTGQAVTPILVSTHSTGATKGCPAPATAVRAVINGPGGWVNIPAVGNDTSDVSNTAEFSVPLGNSFVSLSAFNNVPILAGKYDITLYCQDDLGTETFGTFTGSLFFTDTTHFQSADPAGSTTTTTTGLVVGPDSRQDLGKPVTLTASLTPAGAVGTVQFKDTTTGLTINVGKPITVTGGMATLVTSSLPFGMHTFAAIFTPTNATKYEASTSDSLVYVVALPIPPKLVVAAHILGPVQVGGVLGCFASYQLGTSTAYTWYRNGRAISGAVRSTYRLTTLDFLRTVACRTTARNLGGSTPSMSRTVAVGLPFKKIAGPSIRGTHQIGKSLLAIPGTWSPKPLSYSYVWLRDGKAIPGATKQAYRVVKADMGHKLTVTVTVKATYYSLASATSKPI